MSPLHVGLNSIELIGPVAQDAFQFYFVLGLRANWLHLRHLKSNLSAWVIVSGCC